jgi:hypothetical protein
VLARLCRILAEDGRKKHATAHRRRVRHMGVVWGEGLMWLKDWATLAKRKIPAQRQHEQRPTCA